MAKLKIGIVGCGAIGSSLAKTIAKDFKKEASISALFDLDNHKSLALAKKISGLNNLIVKSLAQLINRSQFVIESSSSKCSWDIAKKTLSSKRDIMIMSVGGLSGKFNRLTALAKRFNRKVYIPSGAICGIDGLKALKFAKIKKVTLTTTKNPESFKGVKYIKERRINLDKLKKEKVVFLGRAKDAVKYFPQNINVAAVLSLAGIGEGKTFVKIVASPFTRKNIHQVYIESSAGTIIARSVNVLHPENPKTSYLAVLSAVAVLKQILSPVKIGT